MSIVRVINFVTTVKDFEKTNNRLELTVLCKAQYNQRQQIIYKHTWYALTI